MGFHGEALLAPRPTPKLKDHPFGCPRLLIQFIRSCPPYRRPFLHPQPEDAPCRGDRDPPHMGFSYTTDYIYIYIYIYLPGSSEISVYVFQTARCHRKIFVCNKSRSTPYRLRSGQKLMTWSKWKFHICEFLWIVGVPCSLCLSACLMKFVLVVFFV